MHAPLENYRLTRIAIMATFVTDSLDEGQMEGESEASCEISLDKSILQESK